MKLHRKFIRSIDEWSQTVPLSVLGPTGSGKTSTVISFCKKHSLNPYLVSLDSVAAYTELNIGSSKPLGEERVSFEWLGLDLVPITEKINASIMKSAVLQGLVNLQSLHSEQSSTLPPVFVGGTHFYERFILEGAAPGEASDRQFIKELESKGAEKVLEALRKVDPRWSEFLHLNDHFRIFRYADLVLRQGLSFDLLRKGSDQALYPIVETLILEVEKDLLEVKLQKRIDQMFEAGWLGEVEVLLKSFSPVVPGLQSIGYVEVVEHLTQKKLSFTELKEKILIRHRQLAKQQRTWLRSLKR
jgi:tRNA dimethylallyltransferase